MTTRYILRECQDVNSALHQLEDSIKRLSEYFKSHCLKLKAKLTEFNFLVKNIQKIVFTSIKVY